MAADYDKIAHSYDALAGLMFGKSIRQAQECLIPYIPPSARVLIVGGGTGWILAAIARHYPQGLTIDYIEASAEMIALSQRKNYGANTLRFIHLPVESLVSAGPYDVIFTPFVFDNFEQERAATIFAGLSGMLREGGVWLHADFVYESTSPLWQKMFLKVMYVFFRLTCGIEASKLTDMTAYFSPGYKVLFEASFYSRFILAQVYRKQ